MARIQPGASAKVRLDGGEPVDATVRLVAPTLDAVTRNGLVHVALPKGSKLQFITHFDNSPANRFNPDPKAQVVWGPQNWDEMSNCFIGVLFDQGTAPERVFFKSGPSMLARGASGPTLASFGLAGDAVAPVAATAFLEDGMMFLSGRVYAPDGSGQVTASHALYVADAKDPAGELAERVAGELRASASEISPRAPR